jgi:hypothetical protein
MASWTIKRTTLGRCLDEQVCAILNWSAKGNFWALNTVLRPLLPLVSTFWEKRLATNGKSMTFRLWPSSSDELWFPSG